MLTQASRAAFRTLQGYNWLHDEVVNLYLQLLQVNMCQGMDNCTHSLVCFAQTLQSKTVVATDTEGLRTIQATHESQKGAKANALNLYILNTFFWTRLACFGQAFDYEGIF